MQIKFNEGPGATPEPTLEILLQAPKITLRGPLGARLGEEGLTTLLSLQPAQDGLVRLASALNEPIAGGRDNVRTILV